MDNYTPPFTITNKMLETLSSIMEKVGGIIKAGIRKAAI